MTKIKSVFLLIISCCTIIKTLAQTSNIIIIFTDDLGYGDVIEEIDWSVGEILNTLKEQDIAKNTLVIFTSDNGPNVGKKHDGGSAGGLRGGKLTTYEGGHRAPCIVWWPQYIPENKVSNEHVTSLDILPTIVGISDSKMPVSNIIDGMYISKLL